MLKPTERFSDRVENYVRYRPGYPPALLEILRTRARLTAQSNVADIGSGTGIFTALLLPLSGRVFAVEPNAAMRLAAEQRFHRVPNFTSVAASAEATTLPDHSVDLITAAQAFHWFDPPTARREFVRILRPDGQLALIWNERETDTTPFLIGYEELLQTHATDYQRIKQKQTDGARIAAFFASSAFERFTEPSEQRLDLTGLIGRALSSSYAPNPGHPGHEKFLRELTRIFHAHAEQDTVAFRYQTRLYLGRLE